MVDVCRNLIVREILLYFVGLFLRISRNRRIDRYKNIRMRHENDDIIFA